MCLSACSCVDIFSQANDKGMLWTRLSLVTAYTQGVQFIA